MEKCINSRQYTAIYPIMIYGNRLKHAHADADAQNVFMRNVLMLHF